MDRLFKVLYFLILFRGIIFADIINVPGDKTGIQAAIDSAATGDTVLVNEGIYYENISFKGKAITVASMFLTDGDTSHISKTIIDGSQPANSNKASVVTFDSGEDTTSVLNGFTITGGTGTQYTTHSAGTYPLKGGGGIFISSGAKIKSNHIINNKIISASTSAYGAGIFIDTGPGSDHNVIIKDNLVNGNEASGLVGIAGGGILILGDGNVLISNNVIKNNSVEATNPIDYISGGGGLFIIADSPELFNNIIVGNKAQYGGGITAWTGLADLNFRLINNTVADNSASIKGGGLYLYNGHCTAINNIFWGNTAPEDSDIFYRGEMNLSYSITQQIFPGTGNIQSDPLFKDSMYHLSDTSPAIDTGNPDPKFNDITDPENPSVPLEPAKGTLKADIGAFGGNDTVYVKTEEYLIKKNFLKKQFGEMHYRFAYPANYDSSSVYPLTVVLHGAGDEGTDNERHLLTGLYWRINAQHFGYNDFTIAPQATASQGWDIKQNLEIVYNLINMIIKNFPVDTTKIVVNGFSKGGGGTKQLLTMYPGLFAAGIPMSGTGHGNSITYKHTPLWIFHGGNDRQVFPEIDREIINDLKETGLSAVYTEDVNDADILEAIDNGTRLFYSEIKGAGHQITRYCYDDAYMFNWLKKQARPLIYPVNSIVNRSYFKTNVDTIRFRTEFFNPNNFQKDHTIIIQNSKNEKLRNIMLYDDGMHEDGLPQDGIWGNYISPFDTEDDFKIGIEVNNLDKEQNFYFQDLVRFTTKGPVVIDNYKISRADTNVYEFKYELKNNGLSGRIEAVTTVAVSADSNVTNITGTLEFPDLLTGQVESNLRSTAHKIYTINDPASIELVVNIFSNNYLFWKDTLAIKVPTVGINEVINKIPKEYKLFQNYPNPFNPETKIKYQVPSAGLVSLRVYNILGEVVATLINEEKPVGNYEAEFNAADLSSGVYFYRLQAGNFVETKKMVLLK